MSHTYLTLDEFRLLTQLPAEVVDAIEMITPGWTLAQLENRSAHIDARLAKRYAVPFATPYPDAVRDWLARLVTVRCFIRRGVDPTDRQYDAIAKDAELVEDELKEAADDIGDAGGTLGVRGMFDLPLRQNTTSSGIVKGAPLSYSEQSPYVWMDGQENVGRQEDQNGSGS